MKGIYLPDTVERFILPNLPAISQLVLYKLLRYSGQNYHGNIWPSVATLARLCRTKQKKTIRQALNDLESWGLIAKESRFIKNEQTSNKYALTFDFFEDCDKVRGVKFKRKGSDLLQSMSEKLDAIADGQRAQLKAFEQWCRKNKFTVDVMADEIDISYMNPFSQTTIRQQAAKQGLLLNFKTG